MENKGIKILTILLGGVEKGNIYGTAANEKMVGTAKEQLDYFVREGLYTKEQVSDASYQIITLDKEVLEEGKLEVY